MSGQRPLKADRFEAQRREQAEAQKSVETEKRKRNTRSKKEAESPAVIDETEQTEDSSDA